MCVSPVAVVCRGPRAPDCVPPGRCRWAVYTIVAGTHSTLHVIFDSDTLTQKGLKNGGGVGWRLRVAVARSVGYGVQRAPGLFLTLKGAYGWFTVLIIKKISRKVFMRHAHEQP